MTNDREHSNPAGLTRRQLLKIGGATLGALSVGRQAWAQAPKLGGGFISAQTTEATGLDPQLVPALSRSRRSPMMYSQLVRFDGEMNPMPELAESWQISPDSLTWTFKLRQGVKFHDGQELTSADVKFTFDRLFEKSPGKSDFIAVDKVEPAGRYAVKFITKEPFAGLLAALGGFWGFIISEAGIKKYGDLNKAAMGTGPFMLEDWKVEQQLVLKKNPAYFRKGLPYVDTLTLRIIPDEANIVAALRTGQIHHAFIEDNKNFNLLKEEKTLTGYHSSRLGYDYLNINASRGPLKDVRVRQAISWTVDRSQVMRVAASGFGRLTAPATAPMKQWQLPEEQWMRYYKPDVDKAKKLMADAGFASGFTVKLCVIPTFPTMVSGAPVIAAQLKRIGSAPGNANAE
jgi:peptide/nickel transport system substrate-binding protein